MAGDVRPPRQYRLVTLTTWFLALSVATAPGAIAQEPKVPPGLDPGGIAIAHIDTGVNYTLPQIASRLARDGEGDIKGYDYEDDDLTPFDAQPGDTRENPRRHGTSVASIILREAPGTRLLPFRYAAGKPDAFAEILGHISYTSARVVAMPLGGYRQEDWEPFKTAAELLPNVLIIVSAGNEGRNVDDQPIYPAAFKLPNVLVVGSTDVFGRWPPENNTGSETIDIATTGENIEAIAFDGGRTTVSGTSYAVPRIAALAARILAKRAAAKKPPLDGAGLKAAIIAYAGPNPTRGSPKTKHGWIAAPDQIVIDD
ncbi:MAG: S8 family serine peptidase [Pseudomonadota bacterium]